jgi:adenylate cyclase
MTEIHNSLPPPPEKILKQLERIMGSPEFHATASQRELLRYVVTETIAGRVDEIKGYTIATRLFGRREDFDQATDPIVSIQAGKLRRALERYYLVGGTRDPIRIDIPKGTYVPTFHEETGAESRRSEFSGKSPKITLDGSWPTVLVRPFRDLTGDPEMDFWVQGLATELGLELARYQDIRVMISEPEGDERLVSERSSRFLITGSIRRDRAGIKIAVRLIDRATGVQIWSDTRRSDLKAARLIAFQEEVAGVVAVKIAGEQGILSQTLSDESKNIPPADLKTYESLLRYYEYNRTHSEEHFLRALKSLEQASVIEPGCGQVWTMLGRLYGDIYSLELPGFETALETSRAYAEKGVRMNPNNQRARAILAFIRMLGNELPAGRAETERALALNPNSLLFLEGIGYLLTLLGDWERGSDLIRKVIKLNPYYSLYVHYALWLDWFRREDYEEAHLEMLSFSQPSIFWDPLTRAATFGQLERYEEGRKAVEDLLKLKPDFPSRGRGLIEHYIKFEDIVDRVIDGLSKVGLDIE